MDDSESSDLNWVSLALRLAGYCILRQTYIIVSSYAVISSTGKREGRVGEGGREV